MRTNAAFPGILVAAMLILAGAHAFAQDDIDRHRPCTHCGMDRKGYGYSRMLILYQDGSESGVCSLHCAVVGTGANPGKAVKSLRVADRDTRELIDADTAVWVTGGRKRGVMTAVPKWAFATRAGAEAFVREHGGEIVPWAAALDAARKEAEKPAR